jgi:hypothetical protein
MKWCGRMNWDGRDWRIAARIATTIDFVQAGQIVRVDVAML